MLDDDEREVPGTKGYKYANTSLISFFSLSDLNLLKILRSSQRVAGCSMKGSTPRGPKSFLPSSVGDMTADPEDSVIIPAAFAQ